MIEGDETLLKMERNFHQLYRLGNKEVHTPDNASNTEHGSIKPTLSSMAYENKSILMRNKNMLDKAPKPKGKKIIFEKKGTDMLDESNLLSEDTINQQ